MVGCRRRTQWLSLLLAAPAAALATPPVAAPAATPAASARTAAASPTTADAAQRQAALLLYLSEFEDADGEWLDPAELPPPAAAQDDADEQ